MPQAGCCWGSLRAGVEDLELKETAREAIPGGGRIPESDLSVAEQEVSPDCWQAFTKNKAEEVRSDGGDFGGQMRG